jgi:Ser/Thr protein kinase RdoA (MazF antagonist)
MGRMHVLAGGYKPASGGTRRHEWYDDAYLKTEKSVPSGQSLVLDKFRDLKKSLHQLDKDNNSYGLIHADFHMRNFFVDEGKITLFDFDDCQYCWLAADIAVSLFSIAGRARSGQRKPEAAKEFLGPFLESYFRENELDKKQLARLPLFLKLREMINYIDGHTHWDLNNLTHNQKKLIERYRFNIENDIPVIDMDFTNL